MVLDIQYFDESTVRPESPEKNTHQYSLKSGIIIVLPSIGHLVCIHERSIMKIITFDDHLRLIPRGRSGCGIFLKLGYFSLTPHLI